MLYVTLTPSTSVTTLTPGVHLGQVTLPTNCCRTRQYGACSLARQYGRGRVTSPVWPGYEVIILSSMLCEVLHVMSVCKLLYTEFMSASLWSLSTLLYTSSLCRLLSRNIMSNSKLLLVCSECNNNQMLEAVKAWATTTCSLDSSTTWITVCYNVAALNMCRV